MRLVPVLLIGAVLLAGCGGVALPFRAGTGEDSYRVTVHVANVGNLVPNADVKVNDITVGTVTDIAFDNWTARLTVSMERSASLPANAEARVAQKSLLGAEYLELAPPRRGPAVGTLRDGDDIPLARTGHYPETEELLTALSLLLNQGGVGQLQTITSELNGALGGREDDARQLIQNLNTLSATLDARKTDIVAAMQNVDRLGTTLAQQDQVIDNALRTIPPGLEVLERQRGTLVHTLDAVSDLGDAGAKVINSSRDDLRANLESLRPVLAKLADSGKELTGAMGMLFTFPFASNKAFPAVLNGDYGNLYITVDLDQKTLSGNMLRGLTIAGVPLLGGSSLAGGRVDSNPLTAGLAQQLPLPLGKEEPKPTQLEPKPKNRPTEQDGTLLGSLIPDGN